MKSFYVFLAAIVAVNAAVPKPVFRHMTLEPKDAKAVWTPKTGVVGGSEATPHSWPDMAWLLLGGLYLCGGTLLDETTVLTAGHCCDGIRSAEVTLGEHDTRSDEGTEQVIDSAEVRQHEDYDGFDIRNDVCIIKLSTAAELNENVATASLNCVDTGDFSGSTATVTGWGKTSDFGGVATTLQEGTTLNVVDEAVCDDFYGISWETDLICVDPRDNGQSSCNGDSGGPLRDGSSFAGSNQIGIVSFGSAAGCASGPTGFERVATFCDWIEANRS